MSQSPFGSASDGNKKRTTSIMGSQLHLDDSDPHQDAFSFMSGPSSQYDFAAPLSHAYAGHQPTAILNPSDWNDVFLTMPHPEYDLGLTGDLGVQDPLDFSAIMPDGFVTYDNFGLPSDFDVSAISNSPSDPGLYNLPSDPSPAGTTPDIDGEHDSDVDDYNTGYDESGNGSDHPGDDNAGDDEAGNGSDLVGDDDASDDDPGNGSDHVGDDDSSKEVLAKKEKMAREVINAQKKQADPAKQLGVNVTIVSSANGVSITGVYWNPPSDDTTIPSTQAEINACVDDVVAAMRNNEGCREKDTTKAFRNRWAQGATHYTVAEFYAAAQLLVVSSLYLMHTSFCLTMCHTDDDDCRPHERMDGVNL